LLTSESHHCPMRCTYPDTVDALVPYGGKYTMKNNADDYPYAPKPKFVYRDYAVYDTYVGYSIRVSPGMSAICRTKKSARAEIDKIIARKNKLS
jgi:hypothetical protein